ncbi:hypothetical protein GWK47_043228 [Chionoecetes opilio]|uniref:Uncharacterized protein n=1 Tax=Chionoecetes opilio TaxID=41210 RepID=A0A8J4YM56_CHIOP|nr:hypothetical protein GWK47_043228 [Chionoecetes opilio]
MVKGRFISPAWTQPGCWGIYTVRKYVQEPFRCQAFGHYQDQCPRRRELCGVCSGEHATRDCIRRLREGCERPVPRCPNCSAGHHTWNLRCPARLRRIPGSAAPRQQTRRDEDPPCPPPPAPAPRNEDTATPETRRRPRRRRRTRPESDPPTPPQVDVEDDAPAPMATSDLPPLEPAACGGESQQCHAVTPRVDAGSQTEHKVYTLDKKGLWDLLLEYEHLLKQERELKLARVSHEPALGYMMRAVKSGGKEYAAALHRSFGLTLPGDRDARPPFDDRSGPQRLSKDYCIIDKNKISDLDVAEGCSTITLINNFDQYPE